jgi:hypothetical protein
VSVNSSDVQLMLNSRLPSQRTAAANWLSENGTASHVVLIVQALEKETVPLIRQQLSWALTRSRSTDAEPQAIRSDGQQLDVKSKYAELVSDLDDLAGLIRHETDPAIGWLRRAAALEIESFDASQTNRRIEVLRRRIEGLETLAAAHRQPRWKRASLSQLVVDCIPPDLQSDAYRLEPLPADDRLDTDEGLLSLVLSNAIKNAGEAWVSLDRTLPGISIQVSVLQSTFWVSVTNRFDGDSFDFEHVLHTGTSSKRSHKGLGLSAMRMAAKRLGYELSLSARGGTAFFAIRGSRFHA